ncbi:putative GTP-binding protein TypA [Helianthus anomalus]
MQTYDGMIVGEHSRDTDLDVNPVRNKALTNIRSAGNDENVKLSPPRRVRLIYLFYLILIILFV